MTRKTTSGIVLLIAACFALIGTGSQNAFACTATNGCVTDTFRQNYDMMKTGKMNRAILAGQDSVASFKKLQADEKAYSSYPSRTRR